METPIKQRNLHIEKERVEMIEAKEITEISPLSVEMFDLDGNSTVNVWNNLNIVGVVESTGNFITISYELPTDSTATAALFALISSSDLAQVITHRSNSNNEVYLSIKHVIDSVSSWEISSSTGSFKSTVVDITYLVDSAILIGEDYTANLKA